jgi:NADP-dependent 3-hydroxy acid dehydrogenase YdfG
LSGTSALVVGASRGIGEATARSLSAAGARVHVAARSIDALREIAEDIGGEALQLDLLNPSSVSAALARLTDDLGSAPDIVVNVAGVFHIASIPHTSLETFEESLATNLRGPFMVLRELLPAMIARGSGTVVTVGSVAGSKPFPGNAAYSSAKYGLRGLHEVMVEELRGSGVRSCLIEPAATDTSIWDTIDPDADPTLPDRSQMLRPGDVADAVVFVCSLPADVQVPVLAIERC